jgi:Tfp pilus assembly PilM family ATPase
MNGFENHAGFAITENRLQVVEVIFNGEQFILENVDEAYFNEQLNLEKEKPTKISALLQGAFDELQIKKSLKSSLISFTLPFELFHTMQVPYDNTLLHRDLLEEFRWEISIVFPYLNPEDLAIQYIEIEKNPFQEINTAFVIAINKKYLEILKSFAIKNNLKLKFIDNAHLASERALSLSNPLADKGTALSFFLSSKVVSIIHSLNGKPVIFNPIPISGAGDIPSILRNELKQKTLSGIKSAQIDSAFISGDNISDSIIKTLRNTLGIDLFNFNPFDKIKPNPQLFENKCYAENFNSFSPAAGIAFRLA